MTSSLSNPAFQGDSGVYRLVWEQEQVAIYADHLIEDKHGIYAEVTVSTTRPGVPGHLAFARFNLLAATGRSDLMRTLKGRVEDVDWHGILEQTSYLIVNKHREGEPVVSVGNTPEPETHDWALWPLIRQDEATIVHGQGGQGKSHLAVLVALLVQSGVAWVDLIPKQVNVLYLDYEASSDEINHRAASFSRGLGIPPVEFKYRFAAQPLAKEIEEVRRKVLEEDIGLIIVDSLSMAVGGDLIDPKSVIPYFQALRLLKLPSLTIHHKNRDDQLYGSAYIINQARSVWSIKSAREEGSDLITVGLFHEKVNNARKFLPIGIEFNFSEDNTGLQSISVGTGQLLDFPETAQSLPLRERVRDYLSSGSMNIAELATLLNMKVDSLRSYLNRDKEHYSFLPDDMVQVRVDVAM